MDYNFEASVINLTPFSIFPLSSGIASLSNSFSYPVSSPRECAFATPSAYRQHKHVGKYAKFDISGKEIQTIDGFLNCIASGDTGEVDETRLDNSLFTFDGFQHCLGKSMY
jgi:hypothetical protein